VRIDTVRDLAGYVRHRRVEKSMTQVELADTAAVSRRWLSAFEAGKPTVEIGLVLRTLKALDLDVGIRPADSATQESTLSHVDLDALLREHRYDPDADA
jgi:HTH-type transcriptional regulator / antitoxin HipB